MLQADGAQIGTTPCSSPASDVEIIGNSGVVDIGLRTTGNSHQTCTKCAGITVGAQNACIDLSRTVSISARQRDVVCAVFNHGINSRSLTQNLIAESQVVTAIEDQGACAAQGHIACAHAASSTVVA